jgi:poly-gamma-glutamate capsule biosynthesis protein CapA/YwtB (metallophosphatase superfamily)
MGIYINGERKAGVYSYIFWIGTSLFAGIFIFSFALEIITTSYRFAQGTNNKFVHDAQNAQTAHASAIVGVIGVGHSSGGVLQEDNVESASEAVKSEESETDNTNSADIAGYGTLSSSAIDNELIKEDEGLTITLVGDIMLDRSVEESVYENGDGDFSFIFKNTSFLKDSDIVFGNLEGPVSDKGEDLQNLYSFRMDPEVIPELSAAGFNILSVANNHSGDWGSEAFEDTLRRLKKYNILFAGGGRRRKEAEEVTIIEKNGTTVGFLAFSDIGPKVFEVGYGHAGILYADDPRFSELVENASREVDILVVSLHFGEEYRAEPTDRQRELAYSAIDAGADIVAGHHSHIIQDVSRYKDGIITYGLGNFIFDQSFSEETMEGLVLDIFVEGGEIIGYKKKKVALNEFFQPSLEF